MKKIISAFIFVLYFGTFAQNLQETNRTLNNSVADVPHTYMADAIEPSDQDAFIVAALEKGIPQRTFENLANVKNGYYLVSGVFSKSNKLDKQVKKLAKKGFDAGYFQNTENDLYYLYVSSYDAWENAIDAHESKFNNKFKDDVWILHIANSAPADKIGSKNRVAKKDNKKSNKVSRYAKASSPAKLIQRADEYFNKMWYAEASELYEQALQDKSNYSFKVLEKAGDAHYFNTNMEQAYKWYTILYEEYEEEMSADNIFKYAHSLKGNGKYARSKRLMRLYNKKMRDENEVASLVEKNEVVLDEILNSPKKFEIQNLSVNSQYSDFAPMFHNENEIVFASATDSSFLTTRRYKWDNQPYLDLYVGQLNEESSDIKNAVKFSKELNTKYHEAGVTFSPDNKTMYFTRNNYGKKLKRDSKGINHLKIYRSQKVDGKWTAATELPFNSDSYSTGHPALSKDGKKLYFVSDMPGSMGDSDIFVVDVMEGGNFSSPKNLGPEINTEQKEMFPFINGEKLYFSSNGHTGLGGLDIYEATYDEENGFSDVRNLGKPINSNKDDFSYIINEETKKGFFASNRDGGKGFDDLYSFKHLLVEEVPTNINAIAGIVTELVTGDIMPRALVQLLDENNVKLKEIETDEDGSFIFEDLDADTKYILKTNKETFFVNELAVSTLQNDTINVDIAMKKLQGMIAVEDGIRKLKTEMIHFDFDKSYIREDASKELDKLVEVMNEYPNMVIKIESHTDSRGSAVYNDYLSDKRAKSTKDYIISQGIDASRIESAIGYGEQQLLNECNGRVACPEEKHYLNRRSEFIIVNM
ncbi:OmpA family protein [Maribacter chungangensis]|uniref:OmpA family protein n=1 Tax=Maribacter chungangensis TaxID=1069117 RepID=A0ABW3AZ76_9FLAO